MLLCLRVRNFAIIDQLEVDFQPGLNCLTGETGAGKSILVDALQLVLGGRSRAEIVRSGAEAAEVEALFDIGDDPDAVQRLREASLAQGDELLLRRILPESGRSRAYVNGRLATIGQLAQLGAGLVDISSQHEHHTLIDSANHLRLLDAFGQLRELAEEMRRAHETLAQAQRALEQASSDSATRVQRVDLLRFQLREIEELEVQEGERDALVAERERLRHAERLATWTGGAEEALYASDEALGSALGRIVQQVRQAADIDPELAPVVEQLAGAQAELEDAARELGRYARNVAADPDRQASVEERLERIDRLARKYGGSVEAMLAHRQRAAQELRELDLDDEQLDALHARLESARGHAEQTAERLSERRRAAADELSEAMSRELSSLGMGDARVVVEVQPRDQLAPTGLDRVEFLIAPNRGEEPQPLRRIASGGELSRAMLAVKRVLSGLGPAGLSIFDEVDAGVGGAVAEVIGRKLKEVARRHQVICITHLPQIAVFADAHFRVSKEVKKGRTHSRIERLTASEQREEIARMLGGVQITDTTRAAADEMLHAGQRETL